MATLFELTKQMADLEAILEETGGELTEEVEALWQETEESLRQKTDNYNGLIQRMTGEAELIDKEIKRLQTLKKSKDNSVKRVKEHLTCLMQGFGIDSLQGEYCKIRLSSREAMDVNEDVLLSSLGEAMTQIKTMSASLPSYVTMEFKVSKTGIKDAVKAGAELPEGCEVIRNTSITIR